MKRILKRMWDYNYKFYPVASGLGVIFGFIILAVFSHLMRPILSTSASITNAVDPIHATNGWPIGDNESIWSTNIVVPYIRSNYWAEEITTEWVTTADWLLGKQLGLRSDGMVVWREKK